jgi:hypothetical protein
MRHLILAAALLTATPAFAADSVTHASAAVTASGQVVGNLSTAGIQAVRGVLALPMGVAGGASEVVGTIANAGGESLGQAGTGLQKSADEAIEDAWGPLKVDDRIVLRPDPAPAVPYGPTKPAAK